MLTRLKATLKSTMAGNASEKANSKEKTPEWQICLEWRSRQGETWDGCTLASS